MTHDATPPPTGPLQSRWSLRARISVALFLSAFMGVALLGGYGTYSTRQAIEENIEGPIMAESALAAHHAETVLEEMTEDVRIVADSQALQSLIAARNGGGFDPVHQESSARWKTRVGEAFAALMKGHPRYEQVRYLEETGKEIVRVNEVNGRPEVVPEAELQDKSHWPYFRETMKLSAGQVYVSPLDLRQEHGRIRAPHQPMVRLAVPVFNGRGERRGLVILNADPATVLRSFEHAHHEDRRCSAFVADQNGFYVYHSEQSNQFGGPTDLDTGENLLRDYPEVRGEGEREFSKAKAEAILSGRAGHVYTRGGEVIFYQPIVAPGTPRRAFIMGRVFSQRDLFAPLRRWGLVTGVVALFALLLAGGLALALSGRLVRPLRALADASAALRNGNLAYRVQVTSADEVGALATAFNDMAERVQESHTSLEQRVAERTRELAERNEEIEALYEAERAAARRAEGLREVAVAASTSLDIEAVLQTVADRAREFLEADFAEIHFGEVHANEQATGDEGQEAGDRRQGTGDRGQGTGELAIELWFTPSLLLGL